jgi:hypothetical protein
MRLEVVRAKEVPAMDFIFNVQAEVKVLEVLKKNVNAP